MAYIPTNAKWYISELVEQISVDGDPRNVVHKNLVLIRADSPEEAYQKALLLGREREISYENPAGKQVRFRFRGLSELNVISDSNENIEIGSIGTTGSETVQLLINGVVATTVSSVPTSSITSMP